MKKSIVKLIIALAFTGILSAQNKNSYNFAFNHLALCVKNMNKSEEFYKNVLKLQEITNRSPLEGIRWFSLGDGKELHLISIIKENVTINKAVHLALTTSDFKGFVKRLDNMNIPYSNWEGKVHEFSNQAAGIKEIYFQDPDGYWIQVNSEAVKRTDKPETVL